MLRYASLDWHDDAAPFSPDFGDRYYARGDVRAETEHVFLGGCNLPEAWQGKPRFTIAETGFGTGLNFLHTWQRFCATASQDAVLHYISVEAFPLSPSDRARALSSWEGDEAAQLLAQYPHPVPGWHRLNFPRVKLTLGYGDAAQLLSDYDARVDAWFLDGFSPATNPDMWSDSLCDAIARLSHHGTRLASFTSAGWVRRALAARGFEITRRAGFAGKRHAIAGIFNVLAASENRPVECITSPEAVAVIGAGIAGCSVARALAERGVRVTVYDAASELAAGASGNPRAVLYPHLTQHYGANMAWHLSGFAHAVRALRQAPYAELCGMFKTPKDAKDEARLRAACAWFEPELLEWRAPEDVAAKLGAIPPQSGAWWPDSGWVNPRAWCKDLLQHKNIALQYNKQLQQSEIDGEGKILLTFTDGSRHAVSHAILAIAQGAAALTPDYTRTLFPSAGQVSMIPQQDIRLSLRGIVCHRGYVIPATDGGLVVGATYDHQNFSTGVTQENHARNAEELRRAWPELLIENTEIAQWQGRTSLRASTRDRLPLVGKIKDTLYLSIGHGSRGMISAPYAAEVIASAMLGEPPPIATSLARAVSPKRVVS
jgi:tRNA 5-methylaminomethyl-2-thiouridine biosynthesis bifunctional protein